jgi:hypothetical protein
MCARVLLAGATGAIGTRLMPLLLQARAVVFGTTRAAVHAGALRPRGIEPIVVDVFNAPAVVMHQLTDLALIHDPGRLAEARRVMAQSIAWVYAPGPEPHAEADPLDFGAAGTAASTIRGMVALERAALTAPTLIENSPRTSVQTHIPRERFILLMAERISRTLFCCTSIVNCRHAGLEGGSSVEGSCSKTAVFAHGSLRCCRAGAMAYRMTLSAWKRRDGEMVRPRVWAVLRLITSSKVVGCSTGRSAGLPPFRILST